MTDALHCRCRRAAAGTTVVPILREDFMGGVNQHQVQNVHIAWMDPIFYDVNYY